jgi:choline-glycine betaine transporter
VTASVAPFALVMLLVCASLFRTLQEEGRASRAADVERRRRIDALLERNAAVAGAGGTGGAPVDDRPARHDA